MDIVLITRDRPELTEQCIRSMRENAADWSGHRLVVVFDGSETEAQQAFAIHDLATVERIQAQVDRFGPLTLIYTGRQVGVGGAKNFGVAYIQRQLELFNKLDLPVKLEHAENSLLMFSDNDMYYLPDWDAILEHAAEGPVTQIGGWRHPYHQLGHFCGTLPNVGNVVHQVDAVTGNCFVMRWSDWLKYGPFDSNAIGPGQSEDYALSQRIRAGGGLVATLDPPVAIHCGLVNSIGEPATGWREMESQVTEQLAGLGAEMRDSVLIMRPVPELPQVSSAERIRQILRGGSPFQQVFEEARERVGMQPREQPVPEPTRSRRLHGVNIGSGQRRFESVPAVWWQNVDLVNRPPDQVPDIVGDARNLDSVFVRDSQDYVVSHHLHEHLGHGEADPITKAAYQVLRVGGSLLVFTPDARKLAGRWLGGELDDFQFAVQMMGAYQGEESDRHRWLYTQDTLEHSLANAAPWSVVKPFDWRMIPGADLARDWYIAAVECVK